MTTNNMNREQYLHALTGRLRVDFADAGFPLPDTLHLSVGFPSKSALSRARRTVGQCWHAKQSADGKHQIFISPLLGADDMAHVLVHELLHAALPPDAGHKAPFKQGMKKLGLTGKATATVAGDALKARLAEIMAGLGEYPHPILSASDLQTRKQGTRLLKAECGACGYTVRVTAKWLDAAGAPLCPCNSEPMETGE